MNGLELIRKLPRQPMGMAQHFSLEIVEAKRGSIVVSAIPTRAHYNPFEVVQGGFAATVLDIALGLVSISLLESESDSVATTDLGVRYLRSITEEVGPMTARGRSVHSGGRVIVAEAKLYDKSDTLYAIAQSTSLVVRKKEPH